MLSLNQEQDSNAIWLQICGCDDTTQTHKENITKSYNSDHLKTGLFFRLAIHSPYILLNVVHFETFMTLKQNVKTF